MVHRVALVEEPSKGGAVENEHVREQATRRIFVGRFDWVLVDQGPNGEAGLAIPLEIRIDNLAAIMFVMVTFIASLIHVYSMGYMKEDSRYPLFFTYLSLFCFSMLALVASANIFMIFMCWELVGVCSYLLVGFWYEEKKNGDAANKAFVVNRVGDIGMLIGLGLIWTQFGTFNIADINKAMSAPEIRDQNLDGRITYASSVSNVDEGTVKLTVPGETSTAGIAAASTEKTIPYWVLVVAGLGIFAGCVGRRSVSAPRLAARRDGRAHARLRAHPRGDDGRGGGLFGRPLLSALHRRGLALHRLHRRNYPLYRGDDRDDPNRL